ncbi:MAG: DEAD/DEAH box helicase [Acidobacteria bacterium]|nr:DEAD/DEAH box helicase [Acidobacteriota bacterium]
MDTTNTDFHAYQFKPVLSFLDSPSNGLLIADEVGLGKTIEAGLIWTELRARYDKRRLLVICPAMLREKWKDELASKFSIDASIVDAEELLRALRSDRTDVSDGKALIASLQGVRPPRGWRDEEDGGPATANLARFLNSQAEGEPIIDMVIIDESHYLRNPETQNAELGQLLRGASEFIVLLSATPVNLHEDDLFHQLKLVDPDFFEHRESFPHVLQANEPLVRAREMALDRRSNADQILECLREARSHELLANNGQLREMIERGVSADTLSTEEGRIRLANRIERINLLAHVVSRTRKSDVHELRVVRQPSSYFVEMTDEERAVYDLVTETVLRYAESVNAQSGFLLASPQRQVSSCIYAAVKSWSSRATRLAEQIYDDVGIEIDNEDAVRPIIDRLIRDVLPHVDLKELRANDSKFERFKEVVLAYLRERPAEKLVVFSYYPGTLEYLAQRLAAEGVESAILHGNIGLPKQEVIARFRDDPKYRILLSSEVASEGVDLQFCRVLVNYDLPWNPMKVEQRIGRIDRLGQAAESISILNLGHADTIDHRIFERLLNRLDIFTRALGGLEGILGDMINELTTDLLSRRLTPQEQEMRIQRSALAIEQIRQRQEELEQQASHMIAHGGYILEQVQAAHDFKKRITSEDLEIYVRDYLHKYCQGFGYQQIGDPDLLFDIRLPAAIATALDDFMRRYRLHGKSRLATSEVVRCRFRNKVALPSRQEELISQFHPLIRFISDDLKSRDEAFYPLIAARVLRQHGAAQAVPGKYVFAAERWSFSGLKQEEQVQCRAIELHSGSILDANASFELLSAARMVGNDWLSAGNELDPQEIKDAVDRCVNRLEADFGEVSREKDLDNMDRVNFQLDAAERHRDRQLRIQLDVLTGLRTTNRLRMVPATEGRIRKIRERFDLKQEQLRGRLQLKRYRFDVCFGVLRVG